MNEQIKGAESDQLKKIADEIGYLLNLGLVDFDDETPFSSDEQWAAAMVENFYPYLDKAEDITEFNQRLGKVLDCIWRANGENYRHSMDKFLLALNLKQRCEITQEPLEIRQTIDEVAMNAQQATLVLERSNTIQEVFSAICKYPEDIIGPEQRLIPRKEVATFLNRLGNLHKLNKSEIRSLISIIEHQLELWKGKRAKAERGKFENDVLDKHSTLRYSADVCRDYVEYYELVIKVLEEDHISCLQ
ncbi:hypothetical protein ACFLZH_04095 [Patescibacteria group bacterium]